MGCDTDSVLECQLLGQVEPRDAHISKRAAVVQAASGGDGIDGDSQSLGDILRRTGRIVDTVGKDHQRFELFARRLAAPRTECLHQGGGGAASRLG